MPGSHSSDSSSRGRRSASQPRQDHQRRAARRRSGPWPAGPSAANSIGQRQRAGAHGWPCSRRSDGVGQRQDGGGDAAGHQHVEVGELRADEEQRLRHQHQQRQPGRAIRPPSAGRKRYSANAPRQAPSSGASARGPLVGAEHRQRGGGDPVEQRRLVEVTAGRPASAPASRPSAASPRRRRRSGPRRAAPAGAATRLPTSHRADQQQQDPGPSRWRIAAAAVTDAAPLRPWPSSRLTTYSGRPFTSSKMRADVLAHDAQRNHLHAQEEHQA